MEMFQFTRCLAVSAVLAGLLAGPALLAQEPGSLPESGSPPKAQQQAKPDPHAAEERAAERQALGFLQYLDQGRYADSYSYTSELIRSKVKDKKFASDIRKYREPEGAELTRKLLNASYTTTLPKVPSGSYVVLQYQTDFTVKKNRVETLTMSYENGYWRVAGWHIDQLPPQQTEPSPQSQQQPQQAPQQQPPPQ